MSSGGALRVDGRRPHEVRRVQVAFGVLDRCDGSALVHQGLTKVAAMVNGPREVAGIGAIGRDRAVVKCTVSQAAFSTTERRRRRAGDKRTAPIARFVEETFSNVVQGKLLGNAQIDITLHILQADGSVLAACICATSLALLHAGIPMIDFVSCCSIGYIDGQVVLDLNHQEETAGGPQLSLSLLPRTRQVLTLKMESSATRLSTTMLDQLMEVARIGCHQLNKLFDAKVREFVASNIAEQTD